MKEVPELDAPLFMPTQVQEAFSSITEKRPIRFCKLNGSYNGENQAELP